MTKIISMNDHIEAKRELGVELNNAIPINLFFNSSSPQARHLSNEIGLMVEEWEIEKSKMEGKKRRDRSFDKQQRFDVTLDTIISNLVIRSLVGPSVWTYCSLGREGFASQTRYDNPFINYRHFRASIESLEGIGLLKRYKGYFKGEHEENKCSRIKATNRLIDLAASYDLTEGFYGDHYERSELEEVIILRGPKVAVKGTYRKTKGCLLDYEDNEMLIADRKRLRIINKEIEGSNIPLFTQLLSSSPFSSLPYPSLNIQGLPRIPLSITGYTKKDFLGVFDPTEVRLRRIYNNGTFEEGGRLYGPWWQTCPKELRAYILIDGEPTCEVDYCQLHPTILYAERGLPVPDGDLYEVPGAPRREVKVMFNAMLNHKGGCFRRPPEGLKLSGAVSLSELQDAILDKHRPIEGMFFTGEGLRLQRRDSDIIMDVLWDLHKKNIVALPVHDSIIVPYRHVSQASETMMRIFKEHVGVVCTVSTSAPPQKVLAA